MRRSLLLDDPCIAQLPTQHKLTLGCSATPNPDEAWHTWSQCGYVASMHCPLKTPRSSPFPDPPSSKHHFLAAVQASPPLRSRGSAERPGCLHSLDPGSGLVIPPSRRLFGFFCGSIPALQLSLDLHSTFLIIPAFQAQHSSRSSSFSHRPFSEILPRGHFRPRHDTMLLDNHHCRDLHLDAL